MPRYVILEHDHPVLHWDFMVEAGDKLRTWKLAERLQPGRVVRAELLGDHRRLYLDYEGPVSGNRGQVRRWDFGVCYWLVDQADGVTVILRGQRLQGIAMLDPEKDGSWSVELIVGGASEDQEE